MTHILKYKTPGLKLGQHWTHGAHKWDSKIEFIMRSLEWQGMLAQNIRISGAWIEPKSANKVKKFKKISKNLQGKEWNLIGKNNDQW